MVSGWGNACPPHGRPDFEHFCGSKDNPQEHLGNHLESKLFRSLKEQFKNRLKISLGDNSFVFFVIGTFVFPHLVQRVEYFSAQRTWSRIGAMFVLNMIRKVLIILVAVGAHARTVGKFTWNAKFSKN